MYYYIDGYNLLFRMAETNHTLKKRRDSVVRYLQKEFSLLKIGGLIVFDGKHRRDEESGLSYPSPLEIAYAPRGQTADHYIIERIELEKKPALITVVSDDKGLLRAAQAIGAKTQSNSSFIRFLEQKKVKKKGKKIVEPKETQRNIDRLLVIFEKRLKEAIEEDEFF